MGMTLEQAIEDTERAYKESRNGLQYALKRGETKFAERCKKDAEEYEQLAGWLRELQERRKADSCEGCKNIGLWEYEYEYGVSCPCLRCRRRASDNYEPERRAND